MSGSPPNHEDPATATHREIKWDAVAAIIASLVGLLALIVAGYTAYIQRYTANIQLEQVRAQVWPYLISGNNVLTQSVDVYNRGVGPAIVRNVEVRIDGKPQADWHHVLATLGMPTDQFVFSTVNHDVLTPGEDLHVIRFSDKDLWQRFRAIASNRMAMDICFCSTLGECWIANNRNVIGPASMPLQLHVMPVGQCPRSSPAEVFNN